MIRAYAPLVGLTLARSWPPAEPVAVFAPGPQERALTGEDLEVAEYRAMSAAAASVIDDALAAGSPRAVIAVDVPRAVFAGAAPVVPGVVLAATALDPLRIASIHIDDPEGFADLPADRDAAAAELADSDLLWFSSAEVDQLIQLLAQLSADDGLDG